MVSALLIRIGVDQTYGKWNAPVDPASWEYAYVPIPESSKTVCHDGLARRYDECMDSLATFAASHGCRVELPQALVGRVMHLDPDFETLTYGDDGGRRGAQLVRMGSGDLLVFYAGLRPVRPCEHKLVYALVGLYEVAEVVWVRDVPEARWGDNAHTRKSTRGENDIVVRARPGRSGRLDRCIPIGEWRGGAYRVTQDMLDAWGGLSVRDGYIQRSAVPPRLLDPGRFRGWFDRQCVSLIARNF